MDNEGGAGGGGAGGGGSVAGSGVVTSSGSGQVTSSGIGSVASSGTGGGELPARCKLPREIGDCNAAIPSYWHNPSNGVCEPFTYGGCGGNENRFESFAACQEACQGGVPDMDTCAAPADCVLVSPRCCAACDPVDARAFVAVHRAAAEDYRESTGCGDIACAPCPEVGEAERTSRYFTAACEGGRCVVVDVRESPLTQCSDDAECVLRDGLGCCEGCDGMDIIALNQSADIRGLVCPDDSGACPPCAPVYPPGMKAVCSEGRCRPEMPAGP